MRFEVHSDAERLFPEWDELASRAGAPPFLRPGWVAAWWAAFGRGRLEIHAVRRGNSLEAVMPLVARRGVLSSPTNWHTPLFGPVAPDPEAATALARGTLERGARRIDLSFLDPEAAGSRQLVHESASGSDRVITRVIARPPYIRLAGNWENYLAGLPRRRRRDVGRNRRKLEEQGEVGLGIERGESLEGSLSEAFALEASGWKGERGTAIAARPETVRFYSEVARWAAERGWLQLAMLRLDGHLVACDLQLADEHAYWSLKPAFDERYRNLGPGSHLIAELIHRGFAEGVRSYEFLGTDDAHKLRWTDTCHERVRVQVFGGSPAGIVDHLAWRLGRPAVKRMIGLTSRVPRRRPAAARKAAAPP